MDYRVPAGALFIREFMDVLGIERASLAGCSMGGMVALRTALDYPDRVGKLVLVDAAGLVRELAWYVRVRAGTCACKSASGRRSLGASLAHGNQGIAQEHLLQPQSDPGRLSAGDIPYNKAAGSQTGIIEDD